MGGGKSTSATTTAKGLPQWVLDGGYPHRLLNRSNKLYKTYANGRTYTSQTYADQEAEEILGIQRMADRGRNSPTLIKKGIIEIEKVFDGDYLDKTSTFLDVVSDVLQKATNFYGNNILNNIGASLYHVGDMSGDNLAQDLEDTTDVNNLLTAEVYNRDYNNERSIQDSSIPMALEFGRQEIVDADALRMAGLYQREYEQGSLEDIYKLWYETQVSKVRYLEVLGNAIRALVGTETATTRPYHRANPMMGMMGGVMSGAAMGTMLMPGVGTGIGAMAGAVMGLMSSS